MNRYLLLAVCLFIAYTMAGQGPTIKHPGSASICEGKSLELTVDGAQGVTTYIWRKDATIISGATGVSYTATTSGSYDVVLIKSNVRDTLPAVKVTVNPNPVASFTASPSGLCSNVPVQFTNTSTGSALDYVWSFDDPKSGPRNTSDVKNPAHTFIGTPGNGTESFKVVLAVTDSRGCKDNTNTTVTVKQVPGTQLDGTGYTVYNDLPYFTICNESNSTFEFINISSTKATNTNYQIKWGDGSPDFNSPSFNTPLTHDYGVGKHVLKFIVSGANGCKDTTDYNVFVGSNPAVGLGNPGNTIICSGTSLTFPISNTASNPPGTVYTVSFNDGTPAIVYNHPAPDDVTHRFDQGSCGIFSQGFANSFSATIVASNPCATSAAAVVPIYVSKKGTANFSISPKDTACVNTTVTFTNTGTNASVISSQGQCIPGKSVWHITPATGWTTSGNMGSDLASNPANWQAGDNSLNVVFNTPGIYKIKLRTGGNTSCGGDELERTICINPKPEAEFTTNLTTGCAPLTVTTTNTSNQPNCGVNVYNWSVTYSSNGGCEPGQSDFDFINGTNENSENPQFRFNNPGLYTIRLFTTSKSSNCTSLVFTREITVKAKPNVSFNLPASICQNSSINPSALVNNCYSTTPATYAWTFGGGIPATSAAAQPGTIQFNTAGTHTITLAVTNECGTTTVTRQITVKPTPDVTIPANKIYCEGSATGPLNFTSTSGGVVFNWTNSNTAVGLPSSGTGNIPGFTVNNNGNNALVSTITVTPVLNGCEGPAKTFTITVNPAPASPARITPVVYCQGETASPLAVTPLPNHTLKFYTAAAGGTATSTVPTPSTTTPGVYRFYVSQEHDATGCESPRAEIVVTVNPGPKITTSSSSNPLTCAASNGSITLNGLTANTSYAVRYNKNGSPVSTTITSNNTGSITIGNLSAGSYSNVHVVLNGCTSNEAGPFILNDPNPPATPTATANTPLCVGDQLKLVANSTTAGNISYAWAGPNGFVSNEKNPSVNGITNAGAGTYTVTVSINGCAASASVPVQVNPKPGKPVVNRPVVYCLEETAVALSATASPNHTLRWFNNKELQNGNANAPVPATNIGGTFLFYVNQTNATGCTGDTSIISVIVLPAITGNNIGTDQTLCAGSNAQPLTGTGNLSGGNGAYTYQWQRSSDNGNIWDNVNNATTAAYDPGVINATTKYRRLVTSGPCANVASNVITITIQGNLGNYNIAASQTICEGTRPVQLNGELPTGGSGSFIYQWESSSDGNTWNVVANSNTKDFTPPVLNTTTYYRRKTTSGSCSAYSNAITIEVLAKATVNPITDLIICNGTTTNPLAFTGTPAANLMFSWTNSNATIGLAASGTGALPSFITSNNTKIPVTATIRVTPTYLDGALSCVGIPRDFRITVLPTITIVPINNQVVCSGTSIPAFIPTHDAGNFAGAAVSYSWIVSGTGTTLANGSGTEIPSFNTLNETNADLVTMITVTPVYSFNNQVCNGTPITYTITVQPGISNNNISANQNICNNTAATALQGTLPAGGNSSFTYQWQRSINGGTNWNDIQGANAINYDPGVLTATTMYRRIVSTNLCSGTGRSTSNTITITVGLDARAQFIALKDTGCAPFILDNSVIDLQTFPQNTTYNWYANGVLIGTGVNFPGYTMTGSREDVMIKLVAVNGCKADSMEHRFFTYPTPVPAFTISTNDGCGPLTLVIGNTTPEQSLFTYEWDFGNGQISTQAQPGSRVFEPNPSYGDTTYTIRLKVMSSCEAITISKTVHVKSKPKALFAPNSSVGCSPMTVVFSNTSPGIGNRYTWDFGDGTTMQTATAAPVTHTFNSGVRDTFFVKLHAVNECGSDSLIYAIVVSPNAIRLDFAINGNEATGCSPHPVRFINNSRGASTFTWDFGDGTIVNTQKNIDTVAHLFRAPGTYQVRLHATNGCSDTTSIETITVYPSPVAAFNLQSACVNDTVRFTNTTTGATSYQWQFGDGQTSTSANPTHLYQQPGGYTITLKAFTFNAPGSICSDSVQQTLQLGPGGVFTHTTGYLCNDRAALFQVQSSNTSSYVFDFGDGKQQTTTSNTINHVYDNPGIYTPKVILRNANGCEMLLPGINPIRVDRIKAGFSAVQQQLCGTTSVRFTDSSFAFFGITAVNWDFGDGTTASGNVVDHSYSTPGNYTVSVIVIGNSGCSDTVRQSVNIVVHDIPVAAIQADAVSCTGYTIPFTSVIQSNNAINIHQWSISNGVTNTNASFENVFTAPGDYTVRLIAGTVNGCYDTVFHAIRINASPTVRAGNDVNLCVGSNTRLSAVSNSPVTWSPTTGLSCTNCSDPIATPVVTTPYVVQATNAFGCSGYDTVVVTVIQPLQLTVSADDSICIGQSARLLASGASTYNWSPAIGLNNTSVSNPVANPVTTTRYRVVGYDGFNCFTDTAYVLVAIGQYPTIQLGPDVTLSTGTLHPLQSVVQNGPVKTWNWTPSTDLSCSDCPLPVATIRKNTSYAVEITNFYGCTARDTIGIKTFCENTQVFIANAFTPDNDGINDILLVQGKGIVQVKSFRVFNRWGEVVFERTGFAPNDPTAGWDGKIKGIVGGPDVFVYTAEVVCENGTVYTYKGNTSILK